MQTDRRLLQPETLGTLLVLVSASGFGALAIFAKLAYAAGLSQMAALSWRFVIALVLMWLYVRLSGRSLLVPRREGIVLLLLGGVGYAAMSSLFFAALRFIPASAASLLLYTYPALVSLLTRLLWRTPLGRRRLAALCASAAGTFVLLWSPDLRLNPAGTLLGLGTAVVYSFYLLANQRLSPKVEPAVASTYITAGAAVSFTLLSLAAGTFTFSIPLPGWAALAGMAFFSTALAIVTLLAGIRRLGAATASILSTFEPLVTVALALTFLGERLGAGQVIGGVLIGAGVVLLQLPARRRSGSASTGSLAR